jgi:hypothetical protein
MLTFEQGQLCFPHIDSSSQFNLKKNNRQAAGVLRLTNHVLRLAPVVHVNVCRAPPRARKTLDLGVDS